jgi:hypothetical protein
MKPGVQLLFGKRPTKTNFGSVDYQCSLPIGNDVSPESLKHVRMIF